MAKLALINREAKRAATVAKYAAKRAALKAIINDATRSMEGAWKPAPSCRLSRATRARSASAIVAP